MRFKSNECDLFYHLEGDQQAEPLLFLHGALGSHNELEQIAPTFADRKCLFVDFPGHGSSGTLTGEVTTATFADVVFALLDNLKIPNIDIIGYSLGGYVAIEMALLKPAKVRSIVSHAMKFFWSEKAISGAATGLDWQMLSTNERRVHKLQSVHSFSGAEAAAKASHQLIEGFREKQLSIEDVSHLQCPLLLSVGDSDELVSLEEIHTLFIGLGYDSTSLAVHPETHHLIHLLQAETFALAVKQFWKANGITHQHAL